MNIAPKFGRITPLEAMRLASAVSIIASDEIGAMMTSSTTTTVAAEASGGHFM